MHLESQTAVLYTFSGATGICQYPLVQLILDRYFLPLSRRNRPSAIVMDSGDVDGPISSILSTSFCSSSLMGEAIGPTMSSATLLKGISINGIDPNGTFLTISFLIVLWHKSQEWQNLMTSWRSPGQKKFGSILTSVIFAPR